MGLRTKEMDEKYKTAIANGVLKHDCALCTKDTIKSFKYWKAIRNDFPYDSIAEVHDMIIPYRHTTWQELSKEELEELERIKEEYLQLTYDYIMEGTNKIKTIPTHFHLHLIIVKRNESA